MICLWIQEWENQLILLLDREKWKELFHLPKEVKEIIEEAAGVKKFQQRKTESEKKIGKCKQ